MTTMKIVFINVYCAYNMKFLNVFNVSGRCDANIKKYIFSLLHRVLLTLAFIDLCRPYTEP